MDLEETKLPGVGLRHDFTTARGRRIGVISTRGGERELLVYSQDDPDACHAVVKLAAPPKEPSSHCRICGFSFWTLFMMPPTLRRWSHCVLVSVSSLTSSSMWIAIICGKAKRVVMAVAPLPRISIERYDDAEMLQSKSEPHRDSRRLHFLRNWGHHDEADITEILPRVA